MLKLRHENWSFIRSIKFISSSEVALCLCIPTTRPCMRYCSHIWAGAPRCYLGMLDKLQKGRRWIVGPSLGPSLEPMAHRRNLASLNLFHRYYFGGCSSELPQLVRLPYARVRSIPFSDR